MLGYKAKFALSALFMLVILASGCLNLDPEALAKSNPLINKFIQEHPNAQVRITHFTAEQAKNIIDQIRKDCDNPYIDEKEFYKVTINDTATNFFAVGWIDWETKTIECAFKFSSEGISIDKPNPQNCTSHAYYKCYKNHIYWFDSCGNAQEKREYCQNGCAGETCLGGCKSQAESRCYGSYVYWFDSCGNKQDKREYCQYGCENGFCKVQKPEKSCEEAGGYCIWPVGRCGDGICSENERELACENKCSTAESNIKFERFWIDKEIYYPGEVVRFFAGLVYTAGGPATPEGGNTIYLRAVSPKQGDTLTQQPMAYNYTTGYYEFTTAVIPASESGIWTFYAVAENTESFVVSEKALVKIMNPAVPIEQSDIAFITPCARVCSFKSKCPQDCGAASLPLQSRIAEPIKIATSMAKAPIPTGMVVATLASATGTITNYQCKEGYGAGNYFCVEGGVCCVPKAPIKWYRNAYWQCHGGVEANEGGETTTCKTSDTWRKEAEEFCMNHCTTITNATERTIKCGVSSFRVWNECPLKGCSDSDGGKNYYIKGIVTGNNVDGQKMELNDVCEGNEVHEYFCKEPNPQGDYLERENYGFENYPCPYQCKDGVCIGEKPVCGNGVCESGEADECAKCHPRGEICTAVCTIGSCPKDCGGSPCTDSDGGRSYYQKGTVIAGSESLQDNCTDELSLTENYCEGNEIKWETYKCLQGCRDGVCIQQIQKCRDSDNGNDPYTRGEVSTPYDENSDKHIIEGGGHATDRCLSDAQLNEYYCENNYGRSAEIKCPHGCEDGRCAEEKPTCIDSDGGKEYYVKGEVSDLRGGSGPDQCDATGVVLVEFYCGPDGSFLTEKYDCPYGCLNGVCLPEANLTCYMSGDTCCRGQICVTIPKMYCMQGYKMVLKECDANCNPKWECVAQTVSGYRNAYWSCYDGASSSEGGETACKTYETWRKQAEEFCKERCTPVAESYSVSLTITYRNLAAGAESVITGEMNNSAATGLSGFEMPWWQLTGSGQLRFEIKNKEKEDVEIVKVEATYRGGTAYNTTSSGVLKIGIPYVYVITGLPKADKPECGVSAFSTLNECKL